MSKHNRILAALVVALPLSIAAQSQDGPKNGIVLIIRHAENPENGRGLSPRGKERAKAYKNYFSNFTVDSKRLEPDVIFAANDSKHSHRPRLTVQPFAKAANLQVDTRFTTDQSAELAATVRASEQGKRILICWRHSQIPAILRALGATPETLLPNGKWPKLVYDWVILLSYDQNGRLIPAGTRRIDERLLPGDS